jgi:hypothetical protein
MPEASVVSIRAVAPEVIPVDAFKVPHEDAVETMLEIVASGA